MEYQNWILTLVIALAAAGVAHAGLGSQSFHFNPDNITSANLQLVNSEFSNPGILSNSPFYFFKRISEGIRLAFTFNQTEKVMLHLEFAKTRIAEAKKLVEENETRGVNSSLDDFEHEIDEANRTSRGIGHNVSIIKDTDDVLRKSQIVLNLVIEKAPQAALPGLERALNNSIEKMARIHVDRINEISYANETENMNQSIRQTISENENIRKQIHDIVSREGRPVRGLTGAR